MPIEREPRPLPSPLDYVPATGVPYKVKTGDSWWTLADLPAVRESRMTALDLCEFNFKTRNPAEINWYLRHKVGTRRTTRNGKNYVFSAGDTPGIVYLPRVGPPRPIPVPSEPGSVPLDTRIWVGVAIKIVASTNNEQISAGVMSIDNPERWMVVTANVHRQAISLPVAGAGGTALMIVSGVKRPSQLDGHVQKEFDFSLDMVGGVGRAAKTAKSGVKYAPLLKFFAEIGARTPAGLRKVLMEKPERVARLVKLVKNDKEALGLDATKPNVLMIDLVGAGVDVSVHYSTARFNAFEF